jgi:hypothetical protein
MNDEELEELLRRVRPAGPGPELRRRIIAGGRVPRTWPWALAAAILLAVAVSGQFLTERTYREAARDIRPESARAGLEALEAALGGDEALLWRAELWAAWEQRLAEQENQIR